MAQTAVIHLVWQPAGLATLSRFVKSYIRNHAGRDHQLIILYNNVSADMCVQCREILGNVDHTELHTPTAMFDIPAYLFAARAVEARWLCFLNSYSELLATNWLDKFLSVAESSAVGAVSATGSWESHATSAFDTWRQLAARGQFVPWDQVRSDAATLVATFSPFPNYHLRTNAFLISRERLLSLHFQWNSGSKYETLVFESGWQGMTHQLVASGFLPLVVGKDGNPFQRHRWYESRSFRSGDQENLLVGDNRTRDYQDAGIELRRHLSFLAWGR